MGFERIASLTWRHPRKVLAALFAFAVVAALLGGKVEEHLVAAGFNDPDSESEIAAVELREELGYDAEPGVVILLEQKQEGRLKILNPKLRREVNRLAAELAEAPFVAKVDNPLELSGELPPGATPKQIFEANPLIAADGSSMLLAAHLDSDDPEEDGEAAVGGAEKLESDLFELGIAGFATGFNEVEDQTREDLKKAELIAFPLLALLLLVIFRGVIAASIPLVMGVLSILGTFLALRLMSEVTDTSLFALNIATALSLGLAVDYALLMISRYREEMAIHGATEEAHRRTVTASGRTVMFSGITVAAAMIGLLLFPQRFLYSVGAAGAFVGVIAATVSVIGVSALLAILGERIDKFQIRGGSSVSSGSDGWYRLASGVMRRPLIVAVCSGAVMVGLAIPALFSELTGPSTQAVPPSKPSFEVQAQITDSYDRGATEPITVSVSGNAGGKDLSALRREIAGIEGIAAGAPFTQVNDGFAFASFPPTEQATSNAAQDAVREIRGLQRPAGADLLVSGNTARFIDQKQSLIDNLPLVGAVTIGLTFFLLFMLTGSIVLPIKTVLMNLLTLGVVFGAMALVFGEGLLDGPLDYTGPPAVELITLAFVFAITFGLATDYAVLVLARIKEFHDKGADTREAVASGIGQTGRVISAAALCLAVVFMAFAVSDIFFMKQAAVGQATGVLVDATIVRALLVPSLMAMLGTINWWAPRALKRFQERWGFHEPESATAGAPFASMAPAVPIAPKPAPPAQDEPVPAEPADARDVPTEDPGKAEEDEPKPKGDLGEIGFLD